MLKKAPQWCLKSRYITITATNFCPPNYALPSDNGGWCNPPRPHFDISQPAFETIAKYKAGIVPILYRKDWGANWQSLSYLNGQSLSFRVQVSNGRIRTALNVVPANWQFGQSFKRNIQF
ncbi:hypothetical protein PVK06_027822 [Gossypium arboreum]|uniref:Expansin n=1 Tax=Gossypium arboreum TaxID=29729 RepID=A0ABR0P1E9_GOSAR|nr:hypothetical protein PVK06_027822 [Gossypium arboreum]